MLADIGGLLLAWFLAITAAVAVWEARSAWHRGEFASAAWRFGLIVSGYALAFLLVATSAMWIAGLLLCSACAIIYWIGTIWGSRSQLHEGRD